MRSANMCTARSILHRPQFQVGQLEWEHLVLDAMERGSLVAVGDADVRSVFSESGLQLLALELAIQRRLYTQVIFVGHQVVCGSILGGADCGSPDGGYGHGWPNTETFSTQLTESPAGFARFASNVGAYGVRFIGCAADADELTYVSGGDPAMQENMMSANRETGLEVCYTQDSMNVSLSYSAYGLRLNISSRNGQDIRRASKCLVGR